MRHAELKPELSSSMFPLPQSRIQEQCHGLPSKTRKNNFDIPNYGKENGKNLKLDHSCADEFLDDEIDDQDLIEVGKVALSLNFLARDADPTQLKIWTSFMLTALMTFQYHRLQDHLLALTNATVSRLEGIRLIGIRNNLRAENGSAIISARTRHRMTPGAISFSRANRESSCKHLCCREGVDKARKTPKHSTGPVPLSEKPETKKVKKAANLRLEIQPKLQVDKIAKARKGVVIEKVDLSKARDLDDYSKTAPWDYKKLHRLHESVNNGPAAPIISSRKKPFCHEKAEEPRSLSGATNYPEAQTRRSSDYDSAGMDEFPSPSAILCMGKSFAGTLSTTVVNQKLDVPGFEVDLSDLELETFGEKKVAEHDDRTSTGLTDVGFGDAVDVMDHDGGDKESMRPDALPILLTANPTFDKTSPFSSDGRLFFTTSSPEKISSSPEKRKSTCAQEMDSFVRSNESMAKRLKVGKPPPDQVLQPLGRVLQPLTAGKDQRIPPAQAPDPIIQKSGRPRPEWVNEFDPEFIAEYADVVEFI